VAKRKEDPPVGKRGPHNGGTVRTIINRTTGEIAGYQAILPQEYSTKPEGSRDTRYREPIGPMQPSPEAARRFLDVAISGLRDKRTLRHGLPLAEYIDQEINIRFQASRRAGLSEAQANRVVSTWRSIARTWLTRAPFFDWPPPRVDHADIQQWFDSVLCVAVGKDGQPLSGNFIRNVAALVRSGFDRAKIKPNPADGLNLPEKNPPRVPHLSLDQQFALFGCTDILLIDRRMIGCGMGAGLRVNELLSMEPRDVHLDGADPHLLVRFGGRDRSPTKGRRARRVELYEPGLGFWRMYMRDHFERGPRVFSGPEGGYLAHWPEQFQEWGELAGLEDLTSHYMRHTFAVSMLSGSWGYEPRTLEFMQSQLGHSDIQTTERYYGTFAVGTWARETRHMTGRAGASESPKRQLITAEMLLQDRGESKGESRRRRSKKDAGT
jgi:integrase